MIVWQNFIISLLILFCQTINSNIFLPDNYKILPDNYKILPDKVAIKICQTIKFAKIRLIS